MADAADSKSVGRKAVWVRLPPPAPILSQCLLGYTQHGFYTCPKYACFTRYSGLDVKEHQNASIAADALFLDGTLIVQVRIAGSRGRKEEDRRRTVEVPISRDFFKNGCHTKYCSEEVNTTTAKEAEFTVPGGKRGIQKIRAEIPLTLP